MRTKFSFILHHMYLRRAYATASTTVIECTYRDNRVRCNGRDCTRWLLLMVAAEINQTNSLASNIPHTHSSPSILARTESNRRLQFSDRAKFFHHRNYVYYDFFTRC